MYALALHTSSPDLGLAINNFSGDSRCQVWNLDRNLSNYLHQYLAEFLAPQTWHQLNFIAIAKGPGSFTSTRIGVVTARTLAQQLNCPLFGISSLAAFAWSIRSRYPVGMPLALQMPATKGQWYTAIYRVIEDNIYSDSPDTLMNQETWQEFLTSVATPYQLVELPTHLGNTTSSLLELAYQEWNVGKRSQWPTVFPFYER
ncbi:tRNA (adenosine(37)-N6)-threonylcarbamoyltransferase complex dimerization subunit type 1 TsaB [Aphanothece hegewaldii CCALA 016]|uniref:tRNA (Adenosine(37)-N6)-threonylcarbamoyltransferase complex dimerization subunit type 1 TsaB n=1 Tax=Aphanothece hegewaldii CCALA 016 TaxID=2107694 RepID=A0A2T1LWU8_9CHRO|nr:tRNA (adenosine(37)-N6)-threonylcarbamoyltransferase complex dimerization subunit type 1 TsaB [Aphanothece hegewaldii]PSF36628.1 tRNA (adenosine(37)-N6)-threonylcarbamoyltransferase complex dimerization subunit type 1 TsaB [Aphanothece hegewaldii CCALA 016]